MTQTVKDLDVRFVEVPYKCKCGKEGKEVIVVANNVGVLDTKCKKCGKRILELRILENGTVVQ